MWRHATSVIRYIGLQPMDFIKFCKIVKLSNSNIEEKF